MEIVSLSTRRVAAFAIDLWLLIMGLTGPFLYLVTKKGGNGWGWTVLLLAIVLSYFTLCETLCSGQTLGKWLLRIRVRRCPVGQLTAYVTCGRISTVILLPIAARLSERFLLSIDLVPRSPSVVSASLWAAALAIWPISILFGRGRLGIHDHLWHTYIVPVSAKPDNTAPPVSPMYPWIVVLASLLLSGAGYYLVVDPAEHKMVRFFNQFSRDERLEVQRLVASAEDMSLWIDNGPEFISGPGHVRVLDWKEGLWRQWSVKYCIVPLPDALEKGRLKLKAHARYIIPVTQRGISSATFQLLIGQTLLRKAAQPGVFVTIEYVHHQRVSIFVIRRTKRFLAFLYRDPCDEGAEYTPILLEPDRSSEIFMGLRLAV